MRLYRVRVLDRLIALPYRIDISPHTPYLTCQKRLGRRRLRAFCRRYATSLGFIVTIRVRPTRLRPNRVSLPQPSARPPRCSRGELCPRGQVSIFSLSPSPAAPLSHCLLPSRFDTPSPTKSPEEQETWSQPATTRPPLGNTMSRLKPATRPMAQPRSTTGRIRAQQPSTSAVRLRPPTNQPTPMPCPS